MSIENFDTSNISWNVDGTAQLVNSYDQITVYNLQSAIRCELLYDCKMALCNIWKYRHDNRSFFTNDNSCSLNFIVPSMNTDSRTIIRNKLQQISIDYVENKLDECIQFCVDRDTLSNEYYMLILGITRDYRSGCPICLTNNITNPIIFRNCGHSICTQCFEHLTSPKNNFCPECKQIIVKTFNVDDISLPSSWITELNYIASQFCNDNISTFNGNYFHL